MTELPKVLYVDDEDINLELFKLTFKNELEVYTALSAQVGLEVLSQEPDIHLILSDLKMPVMNGLEFIKEVKVRYPDKLCMLVTAYLESEVMMEGFNKELIFRYLMKPWNKNELYQSILEALSH